MQKPIWTDNHCHLLKETAEAQLAEAKANGVERLINIGTDLSSSKSAMEVATDYPEIWATAGIHPHDSKDHNSSEDLAALEEMLSNDRVVAVGECGLDFYYDHSDRDIQRYMFEEQIKLALRHNLPLVVHTRDAWDETFEILDRVGVPESTIFHCFTGGPAQAEAVLERGGYISFSGILTFKNAEEVREAAKLCPLDSVLVETDAPFLSPEPYRGQENSPARVVLVGMKLSQILGVAFEDLARHTWDNTSAAYRI